MGTVTCSSTVPQGAGVMETVQWDVVAKHGDSVSFHSIIITVTVTVEQTLLPTEPPSHLRGLE